MKAEIIPLKELPENLKKEWIGLQALNPALKNPFFHPALFGSVAKRYHNACVAILFNDQKISGFLPFLNDFKNATAKPIRFCNYEGIISGPGETWDMDLILKKMRLKAWHFDALVEFKNIKSKRGDVKSRASLGIDLSSGLEAYWTFIESRKVRLKDLKDKRRKLGVIKGPLRFEPDCRDMKVLKQFVLWISQRYKHDAAWIEETQEVLEHIIQIQDPEFKVIMPVLYAGDDVVAVDFHLLYQGFLGGLLRIFNPNFEKFSTGILLLHDLINNNQSLGYEFFDLGPEAFQYKLEYSNDESFSHIKGSIRVDSFKEQVKSVPWLYQGILPVVKLKGKIVNKLRGSH